MPLSLAPSTTIHLRRTLMLAAAAVLAACGDASVGPSRQRSTTIDRPVLDKMVSATTITYKNDPMYAHIGGQNLILIPGNAVCDPATSSYGPGTWDKPCNALTTPLTITVENWLDASGHPYIQFQPALRFVPNKLVVLYIADNKASLDLSARIIYCPDTGACVDEAKTDPTLFTFHWINGVYRRIKHFSGYNVAAGLDELRDESGLSKATLKVMELQLSAERRRSGYMVVSGIEQQREQPHQDQQR
jgi:hypothetical protein